MLEFNVGSSDEDDTYKPNEELPSTSILKYPAHQEDFYPINEDGVHDDEIGEDVDDSLKPMYVVLKIPTHMDYSDKDLSLGRWSGAVDGGSVGMPLLNLHFHPASTNENQVIASPKLYFSWAIVSRAPVYCLDNSPVVAMSACRIVNASTAHDVCRSPRRSAWRFRHRAPSPRATTVRCFVRRP